MNIELTIALMLVGLVVVVFLVCLIILYPEIKGYISKKREYYDILGASRLEEVQTSIEGKCDNSKAIFEIIDITINNEIMFYLKENIKLNEPYNPINLDKDVEKIATNVFESFYPTILVDKMNLITTSEYFMRYINQQTIFKMLQLTSDYNRGLNESNNVASQ